MFHAILALFSKPKMNTEVEKQDSMWNWMYDRCKWSPTSPDELLQAEKNILSYVKVPFTLKFINIPSVEGNDKVCKIRTICFNNDDHQHKTCTPLVLLHGLGSAIGLWVLNLDALSRQGPLYAFDVLGFGASSRPNFSSDPETAEIQLVESIEHWRQSMKLEKFIMLGHSMGGYLASAYAMKYPHHISHLILADPWGFPEKDLNALKRIHAPFWVRAVASVMKYFNPLSALRVAGPWGPSLVTKIRNDLTLRYMDVIDKPEIVPNYIYHCNAQTPSGEAAFKTLSEGLGWAKNPMINRIQNLSDEVPITFIYGGRSWIDSKSGYEVQNFRKNHNVEIKTIAGAGHHVYGDDPEAFNSIVLDICNNVNNFLLEDSECKVEELGACFSESLGYSV